MSNVAQSGSPGGWGAVKGSSRSSRTATTTTEEGTYTDPSGKKITRAEAMRRGFISSPGETASKLASIGASIAGATSKAEARLGIEEAQKTGQITKAEAIQLTKQNIEGKPLQVIRQAEKPVYQPEPSALSGFLVTAGLQQPIDQRTRAQQALLGTARPYTTSEADVRYVKLNGKMQLFVPQRLAERAWKPESYKYQGLTAEETIRKAGIARTTATVLTSTDLSIKTVATGARGVSGLFGVDSNYEWSKSQLAKGISERITHKPTPLQAGLESPLTAAIPYGAGIKAGTFLARTAIVKGAAQVGKVSVPLARGIKSSQLAIEPLVGVGVAGYVGKDILSSSNVYEGIGKLASYAVMTPGAAFGYKQTYKGITAFQTRGLKTVEAPIKPEVLTGKEVFPTTKAGSFEAFKTEFKYPKGKFAGYHATSEAFGNSIIEVQSTPSRALDVHGLYISPYSQGTSPVFLRVAGETGYKNILRQLFTSAALKPEINLITGITNIRRIPGGKNVQTSRQFLSTVAEKTSTSSMERMVRQLPGSRSVKRMGTKVPKVDALSQAYIEPKIEMGGFRGEAQAVLAPGTQISGIQSATRIKYKGYYIPLVERSILSGKGVSKQIVQPSESVLSKAGFRERAYYESGGITPISPIYPISKPTSTYTSRSRKSSYKAASSTAKSSLKGIYSSTPASSYKLPPSRITTPSSRRTPPSSTISSSILKPSSYKPPTSYTKQPPRIRPPSRIVAPYPYKPPFEPPRTKQRRGSQAIGKPRKISLAFDARKFSKTLGGKTFKILSSSLLGSTKKATKRKTKKRKSKR